MTTFAYMRVSTNDQTTANQKKSIEDCGFAVDEWYAEEGVSGSTEAIKRPVFAEMMSKAKKGDCCIVTFIDRIGRDAGDILNTIKVFKEMGVKLRVTTFDGLDVTSPTGKLVVTILSGLAEMEKNILVERTKMGMARAKDAGVKLGQPLKITPEVLESIVLDQKNGLTLMELSDKHNVPRNSIHRNVMKWKDDLEGYRKEFVSRQQQYALNKNVPLMPAV